MFGLFKSAPFTDPFLGVLVRSRGLWRGQVQLGSGAAIPLALAGTRTAPDPAALAKARDLQVQVPLWRDAIAAALFEHYSPYADAVADGESPEEVDSFPTINSPAEVWPHVSLEFVSILRLGEEVSTELGYTTAWDGEHTLGARFSDGKFIELCGSVLPP